jgi:hypothetical protein
LIKRLKTRACRAFRNPPFIIRGFITSAENFPANFRCEHSAAFAAILTGNLYRTFTDFQNGNIRKPSQNLYYAGLACY